MAFFDWPDGKAHTIPYAQHLRNIRTAGGSNPGPSHSPAAPIRLNPVNAFGWGGSGPASASGGAPASVAAPPAAGAAPAAPAAAPGAPDPRDSQFGSDVAGLLFNNKNQHDDLARQQSQGTEDFNTMLGRMADARAKDLQAQNYGANREGLFYSGQLGKRRDDTEKDYSQREGDARTSYTRQQEALQQALDRLGTITADPNSPLGYTGTGQAGLDLGNAFGGAVGRRAILDQSYIPPEPAAAAPAAAAGAAAPRAIKVAKSAAHGGAKWVYQQNSNGSWTPIRPA